MAVSDLGRFVAAQSEIYPQALAELQAGQKRSHWMWFIFPQLAGLGRSPTAIFYALASLEEARAFLAHPLLGPRLVTCAEAVLGHRQSTAEAIFGTVDAMKLKSSMTLFEAAAADAAPFAAILNAFFARERDAATLALLDG